MREDGSPRRVSRLLFPVCVSLLTFSNSLNGAFVIDDGSAVRTNQDLRSETPLSQLLVRDFWGRPIEAATSVKSYRPLTVLSFRWNFSAHGLDVWGYHAVNVLLHALCTALVHLLARAQLSDELAADVAALSFAVHPVHCEAVASIVGRAELLCCVFYLLCLLAHHGCSAPEAAAAAAAARGSGAWPRFAVAMGCAVLAALSKETGLTAPAASCALDLLHALSPGEAN